MNQACHRIGDGDAGLGLPVGTFSGGFPADAALAVAVDVALPVRRMTPPAASVCCEVLTSTAE